jgi:hypothetical protein
MSYRIPTTTIICTKSEFADLLRTEFGDGKNDIRNDSTELIEVIDGLVRQANEHRGVFEGYNAYLDLAFKIRPDKTDHFCGCSRRTDDNHAKGCPANLDLLNTVEFELPMPAETMADYQPKLAVRAMLDALAAMHSSRRYGDTFTLLVVAVNAETEEQMNVQFARDTIHTWMTEQVQEIRTNRDNS